MKKFSLFVIAVILVFGVRIDGEAKYEDVKPVLEKMASVMDKFIGDLEKVDNADGAAAALTVYTDDMEKLFPVIKGIVKKYPELTDEKNHPEDLKPYTKKVEELAKQMLGAMVKIQPFAEDAKVKAAMERLAQLNAGSREDEPKDPAEQKQEKTEETQKK